MFSLVNKIDQLVQASQINEKKATIRLTLVESMRRRITIDDTATTCILRSITYPDSDKPILSTTRKHAAAETNANAKAMKATKLKARIATHDYDGYDDYDKYKSPDYKSPHEEEVHSSLDGQKKRRRSKGIHATSSRTRFYVIARGKGD